MLTSAQHVPALIYRTKHMVSPDLVSDAGIRADFHFLHFILQDIIPGRFNRSGGGSALCINFHICPKDYLSMAVQAVAAVPGHALPI